MDVGSTTVKAALLDPATRELLYSTYRRHYAHQTQCASEVLLEASRVAGGRPVRMAMSGSGGKALADCLGVAYMQEVVANAVLSRQNRAFPV